jgi:hypothetical protein
MPVERAILLQKRRDQAADLYANKRRGPSGERHSTAANDVRTGARRCLAQRLSDTSFRRSDAGDDLLSGPGKGRCCDKDDNGDEGEKDHECAE